MATPVEPSALVVQALERAVRAEESSKSAHHRLDRMNGSIERLGHEQAQTRETFAAEFKALREELGGQISGLERGSAFTAGKMAVIGALALLLIPAVVGGVVALILHYVFGVG